MITLNTESEILAYHIGLKDIQIINLQVSLEEAKTESRHYQAEVERVKEHYRQTTPPVDTDELGGELRREPHTHTDEPNFAGSYYPGDNAKNL